jgi:O-antigen/teichoic acid export membrane protein
VGRAFWNLVDQGLSSLTNAALSVVVARSVDELDFGGFALAFTIFSIVVGLSRNLATGPMPIRFSGAPRASFDGAAGGALGTALCFGVVTGIGSVLVGLLMGGVAGSALLALGVVLPGLLVQDAWRQVFFAQRRPAAAALNDAAWAVLQVGVVALLLLGAHVDTAGPLILAWGAAALGAALLARVQSSARPRPLAARRWVHEHRDLTRLLLGEFGTQQGALQGSLLVITAVSSLAVIGTLRGSQVLLGVMNLLFMATVSFVTPEFSRRRSTLTVGQWTLGAVGVFVVVGGVSAAWGLMFLVLPDAVGRSLLGETWNGVSAILAVAVVGQVVQVISAGPAMMLRAMDRVSVTFTLNAIECPLVFALGVVGAVVDGARGAIIGFAVAYALVAPFWWYRFTREARRLAASRSTTEAPESPQLEAPASPAAGGDDAASSR